MMVMAVFALLVIAEANAPPPVPPSPLTLKACIQEALVENPDFRAAAARVEALTAAVAEAAAGRLPRIDLTVGYSYSERAQRLTQPSFQGEVLLYDNDIIESAVEARLPLFAGGRIQARLHAAELGAAEGRMAIAGTRQDLTMSVAATYLAAVAHRARIDAVQAALDALEGQLEIARAMEAVGRIASLDRLKVEVRAAAVRQQLSQAGRDRQVILQHLAALLGRGSEQAIPEIGEAPTPLPVEDALDKLIIEGAAERPEVRAAQHEIRRAEKELAIVLGEKLPTAVAFARYTARSVVPHSQSSSPGHVSYGSAGLSVALPVFSGGELGARAAQARARVLEAKARARSVELRVIEEVRREFAAFLEARERMAVASRTLTQAQEALAVEKTIYELNRGTINTVLDALAALLETELLIAQAKHDMTLASVSLARAAGRDIFELLVLGAGEKQ